MSLAIFLLLAAGVQYAVGGAALTAPLRRPLPAIVRTGLECTACASFWIGIAAGVLGYGPPELSALGWPRWVEVVAVGLVASVGVPICRWFGPDRRPEE